MCNSLVSLKDGLFPIRLQYKEIETIFQTDEWQDYSSLK